VIEVSYDSSTEELGPITYGALEYLHIGLQGGTLYHYRMLAVNKYGRSLEWSDTTAFQTGQAPEQVTAPQTTVQDIYVIVSWVAPFDNYVPISAYRV
jgi:hypothetical protein